MPDAKRDTLNGGGPGDLGAEGVRHQVVLDIPPECVEPDFR